MAIASLERKDKTISFMGNSETFDYNDFMVRPGFEPTFFDMLLKCVEAENCDTMELYSIKESSLTLKHLPEMAKQRGYSVDIKPEDVTPGLDLPANWDDYLGLLSRKDRHELRRKMRRLETVENWTWYPVTAPEVVSSHMDEFFRLMGKSDPEKARFITPIRQQFFRNIAQRTAELGLLKLFFLELDGQKVATSLCFDYHTSRFLYNSGYDPEHSYYSVGLLLNALCLRDAIESGITYFDFLRGPEPYKYHLGGQDRTLYQMVVKRN